MEEQINELQKFIEHLKERGIDCALGGSGMLYAMGLVSGFQDWDLLTEASWDELEPVLKNYPYEKKDSSGIFASNFICYVQLPNIKMDLISGFKIKSVDGNISHINAKASGQWRGISLSDPKAWLDAYKLMGRVDKVKILERYFDKHTDSYVKDLSFKENI